MLHKQPKFVHRFYGTNSEMIHGDFNIQTPIVGQVKIREHIRELKFEGCYTKVACLDAFQTVGNGIVVQVVGEISNNAAPLRRFVQIFVLGPQERQGVEAGTSFYIHNDIFRYQEQVYEEPVPEKPDRNVKSVTGDKKIMFRGFFKKKTAQLAELVTTPEKSDSESDICSICFEVWTSTGSHRVCSLKCGHLFGNSCVKTWLINSPRCPECNDQALLEDIRIIRAKTISAVDNSNETILRRELDEKIKIIKELEEGNSNRQLWTNVQTALLVFSAIFNVYMAAVYSTLVFGSEAISSVYFGLTNLITSILLLPFNLLAAAFYSIYMLSYWLTASFLLIWVFAILTKGFDEGTHFLFEEVRKARDEAVERAREFLLR